MYTKHLEKYKQIQRRQKTWSNQEINCSDSNFQSRKFTGKGKAWFTQGDINRWIECARLSVKCSKFLNFQFWLRIWKWNLSSKVCFWIAAYNFLFHSILNVIILMLHKTNSHIIFLQNNIRLFVFMWLFCFYKSVFSRTIKQSIFILSVTKIYVLKS